MNKLAAIVGCAIFIFLGDSKLPAQEWYRTRNSKIGFTGIYQENPFHVMSREANIFLNYETAEVRVAVPLLSFYSNDPVIDSILNLLPDWEITFEGKLGLDFINTKSHPLLTFQVEGWLEIGNTLKLIHFEGRLLHLTEQGEVSCMLSLYPAIDLEEFNIPAEDYGFYHVILGQINEAVLIKSND